MKWMAVLVGGWICSAFIRPPSVPWLGYFITRLMCVCLCVFFQVVVMNGCGSLFSCIAAVICDPKGRLRKHRHTRPIHPYLNCRNLVLIRYKCAITGNLVSFFLPVFYKKWSLFKHEREFGSCNIIIQAYTFSKCIHAAT